MNNKSPLVIPALAWTLGLFLAKYFHFNFIIVSIFFIIFFIFSFIKSIRIITIIFMIILLAMLRWETYTFLPKNHITFLLRDNQNITQVITGKIISRPKKSYRGYKLILKLIKVGKNSVQGNIILYTRQNDLEYGDIIKCKASISSFKNASNPDNFNPKTYYYNKAIFAKAYNYSYVKIIDYKPDILFKSIIKIRNFIEKRIDTRFFKYKNFTKAILIAKKENLNFWKTNLQLSGISHLLAVSGLHIAIITLIIFTVLKIFVINRNFLYPLLIIILIFYGFITLWPPSVVRAITMIILFLIGKLIQRETEPNNILAATLIISTAINPKEIFSPGFQMSFLAVLTLFNINFNIEIFKTTKLGKIINSTLKIMLYSFVLNLFLSPVTMYNFNSLNINGVIANLFGIPILGLILPLAILIVILPSPFFIPYQYSYIFIMKIFEKIVLVTSKLPFHYDFIKLSETRFFILLILLLSIIFLKRYLKKRIFLPFITIFILLLIFLPYKNERILKIIAFDTKNSSSYLIETPKKNRILIINEITNQKGLYYHKILLNYLKKKGIHNLDFLIVQNFLNEKNIEFLYRKIRINSIISPKNINSSKKNKSIKIIEKNKTFALEDISFKILKISNGLLMLKLKFKKFSAVFTNCSFFSVIKNSPKIYSDFANSTIIFTNYNRKQCNLDFYKLLKANIFFIYTKDKRTARKINEKSDINILFPAIDGAMILKTDGETIFYNTQLTERQETEYINK